MTSKKNIQEKIGKKFFLDDAETLTAKLDYISGIDFFDEILKGKSLRENDAVIHVEKYPKGLLFKIAKGFGGIKTYQYPLPKLEIESFDINEQKNQILIEHTDSSKIEFKFAEKDKFEVNKYFNWYKNIKENKQFLHNLQLTESVRVVQNELTEWICPYCGKSNLIDLQKCEKCEREYSGFEVQTNEGIKIFSKPKVFEKELSSNNSDYSISLKVREGAGNGRKWKTFDSIIGKPFNKYLTPIWSTALSWALITTIIVAILKGLDTTVLFFQMSPIVGILWILALASPFLSEWFKFSWFVPVIAISIISFVVGFTGNIFIPILTVIIFGVIFGFPLGLLLGSISGIIRKNRKIVFKDSIPESNIVYVKGIILPIIALSTLIPLYILWLNPLLINWISN